MDHKQLQVFRFEQLLSFPNKTGVYVLRDWFGAALYVGASTDGLRARCRRHLTSARSDLIASGKLCVSEIAYIDTYEIDDPAVIMLVEHYLMFTLNAHRPLFNTKIPIVCPVVELPEMKQFKMVPDCEINRMKSTPILVMQHNTRMLSNIIDYARTAKDNDDIRHSIEIRRSLLNYHAENLVNAA